MKLILKVQNIPKIQKTDNWQRDYMMTALEYNLIDSPYADYNGDAKRGWIFRLATITLLEKSSIDKKIEEEKLISDEVSTK